MAYGQWPSSDEVLMESPDLDRCYFCWKLISKEMAKEIQADEPGHSVVLCEDCYARELFR